MGLLTVATPMPWAEAKKWAEHVRQHGIAQFINIYHNLKDRHNDSLKFGEEVSDSNHKSLCWALLPNRLSPRLPRPTLMFDSCLHPTPCRSSSLW